MKKNREQMFLSCLHSKNYGQNHRISPTTQSPSPSLSTPHHPIFNIYHPSLPKPHHPPFNTHHPIFNTPHPSLPSPHHPTLNTHHPPLNNPHPSPQSPCPIKNINLLKA